MISVLKKTRGPILGLGNIIFTLFLFLFPSQRVQAIASQPAGPELIELFLSKNQELSTLFFEENLSNAESAINCLQSNTDCEQVTINTEGTSTNTVLKFDQETLIGFFKDRFAEYRLIVGLSSYAALSASFRFGQKKASVTPTRASGYSIFQINDEVGKAEYAMLTKIYENEKKSINSHNIWVSEFESVGSDKPIDTVDMSQFFKNKLAIYSQKYPFFRFMHTNKSDRSSLITAIQKLKNSYSTILSHISKLSGDDRFELLGFISVFNTTLNEFNREQQLALQAHFQFLKEQNTWLQRIISVITDKYTMFMIGCYTFAIFAPPVAIICGAIGLSFVIPGVYNLVQQTKRLNQFMNSSQYDEELFNRYMVNNIVSGIMYGIWLRSSIPTFGRNLVSVRATSKALVQTVRSRGTKLLTLNSAILMQELQIIRSYVIYYSKEMGLEAGTDQISRLVGKSDSIVPAVSRAFLQVSRKVQQGSPSIFKFSDMLTTYRATAMATNIL